MNTVQYATFKDGKKEVSLNGTSFLKKIILGDKVSQSDFENLVRGDQVFTHQSNGVTTIHSIVKGGGKSLVEDLRNLY